MLFPNLPLFCVIFIVSTLWNESSKKMCIVFWEFSGLVLTSCFFSLIQIVVSKRWLFGFAGVAGAYSSFVTAEKFRWVNPSLKKTKMSLSLASWLSLNRNWKLKSPKNITWGAATYTPCRPFKILAEWLPGGAGIFRWHLVIFLLCK